MFDQRNENSRGMKILPFIKKFEMSKIKSKNYTMYNIHTMFLIIFINTLPMISENSLSNHAWNKMNILLLNPHRICRLKEHTKHM